MRAISRQVHEQFMRFYVIHPINTSPILVDWWHLQHPFLVLFIFFSHFSLNLVLDKTCYFHLAGQQTQVSESPTACPLQASVWFTSQRTDLQSYCISAFVGRSCLGYGLRQSLSSPSLSSSLPWWWWWWWWWWGGGGGGGWGGMRMMKMMMIIIIMIMIIMLLTCFFIILFFKYPDNMSCFSPGLQSPRFWSEMVRCRLERQLPAWCQPLCHPLAHYETLYFWLQWLHWLHESLISHVQMVLR